MQLGLSGLRLGGLITRLVERALRAYGATFARRSNWTTLVCCLPGIYDADTMVDERQAGPGREVNTSAEWPDKDLPQRRG